MLTLTSRYQAVFEADARLALVEEMTRKGMRYAILDNALEKVKRDQIEIAVVPQDFSRCFAIVQEVVRSMDLHIADYFVDGRMEQFTLVGRDAQRALKKIRIIFFICSEGNGIQFLSADEFLSESLTQEGVTVVSNPVLLLEKLIKKLLSSRQLHTRHDADFSEITKQSQALLVRHLTRFLPAARAAELVERLVEGEGSEILLSARERRRVLMRLWLEQGVCAFARSVRFFGFHLRNWLLPKGVFISVSGPDGSGKTTVIKSVIEQLSLIYGDGAVHYAHFRPTVLPRIAEVAKKTGTLDKVDEDYDRPHRATPSGWAGSMARLAYYCLDYLCGYYRSILPVLKRREVMLYDRYYYDMIADSFRSRIALPMALLRSAGRLLPLPRYAFYIHVDAEEIHRRKQELTMEQIINLNERYNDLTDRGWLTIIDNNGAPEIAAAAIVDHIIVDRDTRARQFKTK